MWTNVYQRFEEEYGFQLTEARIGVPENFFTRSELQAFRVLRKEESSFLIDCLLDQHRRIFVKCLASMSGTVPKPLFAEFIKAGVYCVDPSFNKHYLLIPFKSNPSKAFTILMDYLKNGTDFEIAGAANAFYWFDFKRVTEDDYLNYKKLCLNRFIESDSVEVLRSLITKIDPETYSDEYKLLLEKAFQKALSYDDDYIKNRCEIYFGGPRTFSALPHRNT